MRRLAALGVLLVALLAGAGGAVGASDQLKPGHSIVVAARAR